jgi:hypothetical protein
MQSCICFSKKLEVNSLNLWSRISALSRWFYTFIFTVLVNSDTVARGRKAMKQIITTKSTITEARLKTNTAQEKVKRCGIRACAVGVLQRYYNARILCGNLT